MVIETGTYKHIHIIVSHRPGQPPRYNRPNQHARIPEEIGDGVGGG